MKENIDLKVFKSDKDKLKNIKAITKKTYGDQIQKVFSYSCSLPVEMLAENIINTYLHIKKESKETITIKSTLIQKEEVHLRKVYNALLTKIPRLEYKEMLLLIINQYLDKIN